ncbi:MAG: MFS transporter [Anaerolineae bacterium]|nr:MFS transporter [Anaerolineae bacterium]
MPVSYVGALRGLSRNVRLVLLAVGLQGFSVAGIYAVLLNLFLLRLGYGPEFVGLVNGSGLAASALFCLPASAMGRRWGSRQAMMIGVLLTALGYAALPLTRLLPPAAVPAALISAYLTANLGGALRAVNVIPYLMGAARPEARSHAFSLDHAITPGSAFLGSLVGGLLPSLFAARLGQDLSSPAPYGAALLVGAVCLLPAAIALTAARDIEDVRQPSTGGRAPSSPGSPMPLGLMLIMALVLMIRVAGDRSVSIYFNVYMDDFLGLPTPLIGTITAAGQLLAIPAALTAPLLTGRLGNGKTYALAALGMSLSLLPLALVPTWQAAAFSYIGLMTLISVARPAVIVHQQSLVTPEWRSTMAGIQQMGVAIGSSSVAYAGGYLASAHGYRAVFLMGAALVAAGAGLFWAYFRIPRGELAREQAAEPALPAMPGPIAAGREGS